MENVRLGVGLESVRLLVNLFSSRAVKKPARVTIMAMVFK